MINTRYTLYTFPYFTVIGYRCVNPAIVALSVKFCKLLFLTLLRFRVAPSPGLTAKSGTLTVYAAFISKPAKQLLKLRGGE